MKRTITLLLLFLLLGGGAWYMMNYQDQNSTVSNSSEGNFKVENENDIHKIFIAERSGKNTTLERSGDDWIYNGKYKARPNVMMRLLQVLTKVEMYYTTPRAAEKNMLNNLATNGIKVEIYDKNNKNLKTYYVGGSTADGYGTFMIMEGAKEPFITHIPNFQGTLRGRYSMRDDDWRDRTIFGEEVENIQSIEVDYPKQKNKSFKLEKTEDGYVVHPFYETTPKINKAVSNARVEKYLLGFESIMAEDFENNNPIRDSISALLPFARVSLKNTKGGGIAANFHPLIRKDEFGRIVNKAIDGNMNTDATVRYFVNCSDDTFRLGQHRVFEKMFLGYSQFFEN